MKRRIAWCVLLTLAVLPSRAEIIPVPIGHEYRYDDWPAMTAAPDGSIWAAWLSFDGARDDIAIRSYRDKKWNNLLWVPGTSGDSFNPQIAADARGGVWVVWSQQVNGNWDIYARRFEPGKQTWGAMERLTTDSLPDIRPSLASASGRLAVAWQGFRGRNSAIFVKTHDGQRWSDEVRVTNVAANEWDPAIALDNAGNAWVAWDSYRNGNYDVFLARVADGRAGAEMPVAVTPAFEASASVTVDTAGRVWVAWERRMPNWGKDQGYIIRDRMPGSLLVTGDSIEIRCYAGGRWQQPTASLAEAIPGVKPYGPQVFSDGRGSVWVVAHPRKSVLTPYVPKDGYTPAMERGAWEFRATHLDGAGWSPSILFPQSDGRLSMKATAAVDATGGLWAAWPTDTRHPEYSGRPTRQRIWGAMISEPRSAGALSLRDPVEPQNPAKPGHRDEPGDLRAIRDYVAGIAGKKLHIVRGDFHRHTELSWDLGGNTDGSLLDFYRYMIDVAGMDFGASTDHQGGQYPYWLWYTQKLTDMYHVPGAYVPIFGYERSAVFPNGHRNVFFARRDEFRVTPFFSRDGDPRYSLPIDRNGSEPGVSGIALAENDTKLLYEEVRARSGVVIPHTSGTNQGTDWRDNDRQLEPVVEIFQGSRLSYEMLGAPHAADPVKDAVQMKMTGHRPEGMVSVAWGKGYRLGVIASSDHFSTHLSYAMVYTDDPTRAGILNAIRKRHTYGATDNIILDFRMGEHMMGDEFTLDRPKPMAFKVRGTGVVTSIDFIRDGRVLYSTSPRSAEAKLEFLDKERPAGYHYYYVRVLQDDGMIAWSSPMFIHYPER